MKARLPQEYRSKSVSNDIQTLAVQAQKMQEEIDASTHELENTKYSSTSGGGAVEAVVTGKFELESLKIDPEVVDKDDLEMLSDMIIAAVNEAIRDAHIEKEEVMNTISSKFNLPGLF